MKHPVLLNLHGINPPEPGEPGSYPVSGAFLGLVLFCAAELLKRSVSAPQPLRGKNTVDLIVDGSVLELQDRFDPKWFWPVRVVQNIGGRLRLRPVGLTEDHRAQDVWLFYLDFRLRPLGWALENSLALEPPTGDNQFWLEPVIHF